MENQLRAALIDWLRVDPALAHINAIEEESPLTVSPPWLGIAASASIDWSTKDRTGREVRIAFELTTRGDDPAADGSTINAAGRRIEALPTAQSAFDIASIRFLRARAERRPNNLRAVLIEYRIRLLETPTE